MSGLKLNIEKNRAIWIGSINKSNRTLCNDFRRDWNQGHCKILGVTLTAEVVDIWDNSAKRGNIFKPWSRRKSTLPGKITLIIKSLALSKFVHLFMGLTNPPGTLAEKDDLI